MDLVSEQSRQTSLGEEVIGFGRENGHVASRKIESLTHITVSACGIADACGPAEASEEFSPGD
jgi:hypothetical protein